MCSWLHSFLSRPLLFLVIAAEYEYACEMEV